MASGITQAQPQTQPAPSTQTQNSTPGIILDPPVKLGSEVTDKAVDPTKLGHKDPILSTRLLFRRDTTESYCSCNISNRASQATGLAGNTTFAQELLEHAQYAAECVQTFPINVLVQSLKRSLRP